MPDIDDDIDPIGAALRLAIDRLEVNNLEGEESDNIDVLSRALEAHYSIGPGELPPRSPSRGEPPVAAIREFAFDITLKAAIRVKATTEVEARRTLYFHLGSTNAYLGSWPDGEPILPEVSISNDDPITLYEIDGEAV